MAVRYRNQRYTKLRRAHQHNGTLFTDPEFPASNSPLCQLGTQTDGQVQWKRPKEIVDKPRLVVDGAGGDHCIQGEVGNSWFVAACTALASVPALQNKVLVDHEDQEWDDEHPEKYAGIFRFRFWQFGAWMEVVVDDLLPTVDDHLVCMHSPESGFWCALMEKAYAKLCGSYEALSKVCVGDALISFSGGVSQQLKLHDIYTKEEKKELFQMMKKEMEDGALLVCSIQRSGEEEARPETGLLKGHPYNITATRSVRAKTLFADQEFELIRLCNPRGGKGWNGAWSEGSAEWDELHEEDQDQLHVVSGNEFWMSFSDFLEHFTDVSVTCLLNSSCAEEKIWHRTQFFGEWNRKSAGGCIDNVRTFFNNPQYAFSVSSVEGGTVIIDLMQEDLHHEGKESLSIGFHIFRVEENRQHRLKSAMETAGQVPFINSRSVYGQFSLPEGRFAIVPSTFDAGRDCRFLLRIFTEQVNDIISCRQLIMEHLSVPAWQCWPSQYRAILRLHIHALLGLSRGGPTAEGAGLYCCVICEGEMVHTPLQQRAQETIFNSQLVFFLKRPNRVIKIEVMSRDSPKDIFLGEAIVVVRPDGRTRQKSYRLHERSIPNKLMQGELSLTAVCTNDLSSF